MPSKQEYLTLPQVAIALGISYDVAFRLVCTHRLTGHQVVTPGRKRGTWMVLTASVDRVRAERERQRENVS